MNLRNKSGITLIALIITIIVLLILAGISISLVVGDNGVLTQAKNSSDASKIGQMQESLQIATSDVQTGYFGKTAGDSSVTFNEEVNYGTLSTALNNQGYKLLVKGGDDDKKLVTGNRPFPSSVTTPASFYISDGTKGIVVNINKTPEGTSLNIDYEKKDGKIVLVDAKPVDGVLTDEICNWVSVGDYIDIKVPYTNQQGGSVTYTANGWRVLKVNKTTGVVTLISTAQPLQFRHSGSPTEDSLEELEKISSQTLDVNPSCTRGFRSNGFSTHTVYSLFSNTNIFGGISIPVRADISELDMSDDLRTTGQYYWLKEKASDSSLYRVGTDSVIDHDYDHTCGVRTIVTLKAGLTIMDGAGTNASPYRLNEITY